MIIYGDYHTHTTYSHGKGSILDNAMVAKNKGLKEIAITDHGFTHQTFGVKRKDIENILMDVKKAKQATGVNVILGIEENFISLNGKTGVMPKDLAFLKMINCGYHKLVKPASFKDYMGLILPNNLKWYTKRQVEKNTICIYQFFTQNVK